MQSTYSQANFKAGFTKCLLFLLLLLTAAPVFAQSVDVSNMTAQTILTNIATKALPNLTRLATAFAYVLGMIFVIRGIMRLKHVGEMRTQMSHEHHLTVPIAYLAVGALLLYLPSSVRVGLSSLWTDPAPYSYAENQDPWSQTINVFLMVVQFVGIVAFIRGLVMLSHVGGGGHQQGGIGKALTHIIGGILCINIYQFFLVIANTIGLAVK